MGNIFPGSWGRFPPVADKWTRGGGGQEGVAASEGQSGFVDVFPLFFDFLRPAKVHSHPGKPIFLSESINENYYTNA
jgi:hypothetical protein